MRTVTAPLLDPFGPVSLQMKDFRLPVRPTAEIDVVREMLGDLDSLTLAGRRQTMARIVAIMRGRAARTSAGRGDRALLPLLSQLEWESEHKWPDVASFRRLAESIILATNSSQ